MNRIKNVYSLSSPLHMGRRQDGCGWASDRWGSCISLPHLSQLSWKPDPSIFCETTSECDPQLWSGPNLRKPLHHHLLPAPCPLSEQVSSAVRRPCRWQGGHLEQPGLPTLPGQQPLHSLGQGLRATADMCWARAPSHLTGSAKQTAALQER